MGALSSFDGEDAYHRLVAGLSDSDELVVLDAADSLGWFGDRRALPLLENLRETVSKTQRGIVEQAIRTLLKG